MVSLGLIEETSIYKEIGYSHRLKRMVHWYNQPLVHIQR